MNSKVAVRVDEQTRDRLHVLGLVLKTDISGIVRSYLDTLLEKHKDQIDAVVRVQQGVKQ
jgi:hypothetical protein